jgi:HK97 family phage prohead protease
MKTCKEFRSAPIMADEHDLTVTGYAAVLEQRTELFEQDGVKYYEIIDKNAFNGADMSDVCFRYNHSDDFFILARTRNKTLQLEVDAKGLKITANLADISQGHDLYKLIKRKDVAQMSFAFFVADNGSIYDVQTHTRRIMHFQKIVDVSAVDFPAYDSTNIDAIGSARSYFKAQAEAEKMAQMELKRRKLICLTYL